MQKSNIPTWGSSNNALVGILALNLSIAAAVLFIRSIYFIEGYPMQDYLHQVYENIVLLPANWHSKPWTIFTYNWVLADYWSLFINQFWFFLFGYILFINGANRHLFPIYLYTGILGGIAYVLSGSDIILVGQEMSVIAIAFASIAYVPKHVLFDKAAPWLTTIVIFFVYLVLFGLLHKQASWMLKCIYIFSGICGYSYVLLLQKNIDLGGWMHKSIQYLNQMFEPKSNG
jgi:membrane associated rhomboid family serine protease